MQSQVGILMGSQSDLEIMSEACKVLKELEISFEVKVLSAHRTPDEAIEYSKTAKARGMKVIIAGAGGAAHLAGVLASSTTLPVIGVPLKNKAFLDGWDALLATVQMPSGVPVATVATNGARNAGILAAQMMGISDEKISSALEKMKNSFKGKILEANKNLNVELKKLGV